MEGLNFRTQWKVPILEHSGVFPHNIVFPPLSKIWEQPNKVIPALWPCGCSSSIGSTAHVVSGHVLM